MITCTLGDKKYTVDFVSGRAMRNIGKALDAWKQMEALDSKFASGDVNVKIEGTFEPLLDTMASWFCNDLFKGQFSTEELYDNYPAHRLTGDLFNAMMSTWGGASDKLAEFPSTPRKPAAE